MRGDQVAEVTPIELFFDLVYVLAVTQLTRHLLAGLTGRGALETLVLLLAVWGAWNHIAWTTNYFDLGARPYNRGFVRADDGARTHDPQLGKLMLYQLSYVRVHRL